THQAMPSASRRRTVDDARDELDALVGQVAAHELVNGHDRGGVHDGLLSGMRRHPCTALHIQAMLGASAQSKLSLPQGNLPCQPGRIAAYLTAQSRHLAGIFLPVIHSRPRVFRATWTPTPSVCCLARSDSAPWP